MVNTRGLRTFRYNEFWWLQIDALGLKHQIHLKTFCPTFLWWSSYPDCICICTDRSAFSKCLQCQHWNVIVSNPTETIARIIAGWTAPPLPGVCMLSKAIVVFCETGFYGKHLYFSKAKDFVESHFCMFTRFQFVSSLASSLTGVSTRALSFQTIIWLDGECVNGGSKRQYET